VQVQLKAQLATTGRRRRNPPGIAQAHILDTVWQTGERPGCTANGSSNADRMGSTEGATWSQAPERRHLAISQVNGQSGGVGFIDAASLSAQPWRKR
jgi:hypothetical protein